MVCGLTLARSIHPTGAKAYASCLTSCNQPSHTECMTPTAYIVHGTNNQAFVKFSSMAQTSAGLIGLTSTVSVNLGTGALIPKCVHPEHGTWEEVKAAAEAKLAEADAK